MALVAVPLSAPFVVTAWIVFAIEPVCRRRVTYAPVASATDSVALATRDEAENGAGDTVGSSDDRVLKLLPARRRCRWMAKYASDRVAARARVADLVPDLRLRDRPTAVWG